MLDQEDGSPAVPGGPGDGVDARHPSIGERRPRAEDARLIAGEGRFVADFALPGMVHAVVLRSSVAAGRLRLLDIAAACAVDGVIAVYTAADLAADGVGGIPWEVCPPGFEGLAAFPGDPAVAMPQPLLAVERVRYVGAPVAVFVARTEAAAFDGAEAVLLDIDQDQAVVDPRSADSATLFDAQVGDAVPIPGLFAAAHVIVEVETHVPRLVAAPMETRGYLADFDIETNQWTLVASAGKPHPIRDTIATHVLHVEPARIRVVAPDIGGGFGAKNVAHAEAGLVLWAARRLGRPVRWVCGRGESFLSDMQGRDHFIAARLATDGDGRFLAIQYEVQVNLGVR